MPQHFSPEVLEWLEKNPGYRVVGPDTEDDPNRGAGSYQNVGDWLSLLGASGGLGPAFEYDQDLAEQRRAEDFGDVDPHGGEPMGVKRTPYTGIGYKHDLEGAEDIFGEDYDTGVGSFPTDVYQPLSISKPNRGWSGSYTNQLQKEAEEAARVGGYPPLGQEGYMKPPGVYRPADVDTASWLNRTTSPLPRPGETATNPDDAYFPASAQTARSASGRQTGTPKPPRTPSPNVEDKIRRIGPGDVLSGVMPMRPEGEPLRTPGNMSLTQQLMLALGLTTAPLALTGAASGTAVPAISAAVRGAVPAARGAAQAARGAAGTGARKVAQAARGTTQRARKVAQKTGEAVGKAIPQRAINRAAAAASRKARLNIKAGQTKRLAGELARREAKKKAQLDKDALNTQVQ